MVNSEKITSLCKNHIFKNSINDCFNIINNEMGIDIWTQLNIDKISELLIMPMTFSINYAISRVWESVGIRPDYVIGYSLGEINAACCSGVLSLSDALKMVIKTSKTFLKFTKWGCCNSILFIR